ncbi:hypothetical protein HPB50_010020 [Hyalomma asiaticum]|uniref:Uncharacterized protein n=1 Tax=Hyalomma asiaticum TaxID=266040 RepID=A0ACB7TG77_HYAAI|nr:hypothetical protein HPB50_010020 [Hyalomma asiaticum]
MWRYCFCNLREVAGHERILPVPPICQERCSRSWNVLHVMARKIGVRSIYDTHNNVALADGEQHGPEDLKEKASLVNNVYL